MGTEKSEKRRCLPHALSLQFQKKNKQAPDKQWIGRVCVWLRSGTVLYEFLKDRLLLDRSITAYYTQKLEINALYLCTKEITAAQIDREIIRESKHYNMCLK